MESGLRPVSGTAGEVLRLLRDWQAADDPPPLVIETSGSTGRPKRVVLSRVAMRASVAATHDRLDGPGQWVLNLPPTYVAGVQVLFRSVVAGVDPVVGSDLRTIRSRVTERPSYLSLVPTQLVRALADARSSAALACFDAVLVGGAALAPAARTEAESHGIHVVQTYGMSETCGGCVYDGRPLDGVEVRIEPDLEHDSGHDPGHDLEHDPGHDPGLGRDEPLPAGGRVLLRGPVLFDGYADDPAGTAAVLRDGWFRTDDLGALGPDGRLRVHGRVDDTVNSGGVKVPAPAVAARLEQHPGVRAAHVLGVPDPEWGERVVAVVVPAEPGAVPPLDELRAAVHPRAWAPRQVVPVPELPLLLNGKVDREALRRLAGD